MKKVKSTDVRLKHSAGLWLEVENLGRPKAENDVYTRDEDTASVFKDGKTAAAVLARLSLDKKDFTIE